MPVSSCRVVFHLLQKWPLPKSHQSTSIILIRQTISSTHATRQHPYSSPPISTMPLVLMLHLLRRWNPVTKALSSIIWIIVVHDQPASGFGLRGLLPLQTFCYSWKWELSVMKLPWFTLFLWKQNSPPLYLPKKHYKKKHHKHYKSDSLASWSGDS